MLTECMENSAITDDRKYDFLGITLSTLCGIHCLLTPLAILYFPVFGEKLQSPWIHSILIGFVALSFHQSVYSHYKFHRSKMTLWTGILGFALLLVTYFVEIFAHSHEHEHGHGHGEGHHEENLMLYLAVAGAALLVTSHILNIRKCRCLKGKGQCT